MQIFLKRTKKYIINPYPAGTECDQSLIANSIEPWIRRPGTVNICAVSPSTIIPFMSKAIR